VREVKPDIVLIYSDGEFGRTPLKLLKALPPTEKTPAERIQLLNALCWYISDLLPCLKARASSFTE